MEPSSMCCSPSAADESVAICTPCVAARPFGDAGGTSSDEAKFMDLIIYGERAGWKRSTGRNSVGYQGLLDNVLRSRRFHQNAPDYDLPFDKRSSETGDCTTVPSEGCDEDTDLHEMLIEARKAYLSAEAMLNQGLLSCESWMSLRDTFYDSGSLFAIAGYPDEATRSFLSATFINRAFQDEEEAVSTMGLAVEGLKVSHPSTAVDVLIGLAKCHDKAGAHFQAARCRKEAAELLDNRIGDKDRAIEMYTAAIDSYKRTDKYNMHQSLMLACTDRMLLLHTEEGHYDAVYDLFLQAAKQVPHPLPPTRYYLFALLCVLAKGYGSENNYFDALYNSRKRFEKFQEEDRGFQKGKENNLVRKILAAYDSGSLNAFDVAVNEYKFFKTTVPSVAFDLITARCRMNLFEHLEHFE